MRLAFVTIVLAFVFGLACVPSEPSPNADPVLTSPSSKAVTAYPQLDVRVDPGGSGDVLLNPVPLDGGLFPSGMTVTIEVLPGPGWEIDEDGWKGPVFDIDGDTAKIEMTSTQNIVIKMRPKAGRPAPKSQASEAAPKPQAVWATSMPTKAPTPAPSTVSTCLSIESYYGAIDDGGTFVQTIKQLPIRRRETISISGTNYYDGTWKVLQYFRYNDLWGYRIEKKWQGFPWDDKDPMVCTLP